MRLNRNAKIIKFLITLSIYTTSFDIFLMIHVGGFNFRFTQFVLLPLILLWFAEVLISGKLTLPYAISYLLIWSLFQLLFSFRSPNLKNAFGYDAWLFFNICGIFVLTFYALKAYDITWLLRTYINSFAFMSFVGLFQMLAYACGLNFFLTQHWGSKLARINGFSYEPSYYATYLLIGYIFTAYLVWRKNEEIFPLNQLKRRHFFITLALFLSTSRMGWLMMLVWIFYKNIPAIKRFLHRYIIKKSAIMYSLAILVLLFAVIYFFNRYNFTFFFNGLGLFGQAAHSSSTRLGGLWHTLEIFKESPILGYGLGGVDPMMAQHLGIRYSTEINGLATSVAGEILVATGIATVFILLYFCKLQTPSSILRGLVIALNFELMILVFNQNILRPYLWMHLAVISASIKCLREQGKHRKMLVGYPTTS